MSEEVEFPKGLMVKAKHENAPEYVICKLSIRREELIEWLQGKDGDWINLDVKESKGGKLYASVDTWKPESQRGGSSGSRGGAPQRMRSQSSKPAPADDFDDSEIPFATNRSTW